MFTSDPHASCIIAHSEAPHTHQLSWNKLSANIPLHNSPAVRLHYSLQMISTKLKIRARNIAQCSPPSFTPSLLHSTISQTVPNTHETAANSTSSNDFVFRSQPNTQYKTSPFPLYLASQPSVGSPSRGTTWPHKCQGKLKITTWRNTIDGVREMRTRERDSIPRPTSFLTVLASVLSPPVVALREDAFWHTFQSQPIIR